MAFIPAGVSAGAADVASAEAVDGEEGDTLVSLTTIPMHHFIGN